MITTPQTLGAYLEGQGRRIICINKTGPAFSGDELPVTLVPPSPPDSRELAVTVVARVLYVALCCRSGERIGVFEALPLERQALITSQARQAIARLEGGVQ